jgi:WhiB family transcriptional regulator, redox-sensing transcriptional regulator
MRTLNREDEWRRLAACRGERTALFFPDDDEDAGAAKVICAGCVVRKNCLETALVDRERDGIWGGLTPHERKQLLRRRRGAVRLTA